MIKAVRTATLFTAIAALTALAGGAVPAQAAEHCRVAEECHGPLPQICKRCSDGRDGCAHWACVQHRCVIAYCSRR
ncbi:MAG TPA: hypothetical protein VII40_07675 [Xanthobacteraceae bacterium]|jgi:hypothetical protein